jgi:hypothetical protein
VHGFGSNCDPFGLYPGVADRKISQSHKYVKASLVL